jgi:Tfp pilus assembly protein PilX
VVMPTFARRARQRGATIFVVVLVVTLLMGIGSMAVRAAHLATAASGSERQMTQARYVAEYGLGFATAKLSNGGAQSYLSAVRAPPPTTLCYCQNTNQPQRTCYQMLASDIQNDLGTTFNVCDETTGGQPGSMGMAGTECDFTVELTDLSQGFTLPGFNLKQGKALKFWYVTATSTGQVRIINTLGTGSLSPTSAESSGTRVVRSRILTGPFPTN